jgi:uncharacterized membrane protein
VERIEVSTLVYLPPEEIYEFLVDFPGYANYAAYLKEVRQLGDGGVGTHYEITIAWWKLTYKARARVTGVDPPMRIDWRLTSSLDANGHWRVEHVPDRAPPDRDTASEVFLVIEYDPDSVDAGVLDLPRLVSLDWVVDRVRPLVMDEAEKVVERIVADLEGERRPVELTVHENPTA